MEPKTYIVKFLEKRSVEVISKSELETWNTRRLLRRLEALRSCMEWLDDRDFSPEEVAQVEGRILLKGTPEWDVAWSAVKELLAAREHVPRERKFSSKRHGKAQKSGQGRRRS